VRRPEKIKSEKYKSFQDKPILECNSMPSGICQIATQSGLCLASPSWGKAYHALQMGKEAPNEKTMIYAKAPAFTERFFMSV